MSEALVIGGGPAGLMAAEELAKAGMKVSVVDAKPSLGRKFLMAGKSGLNLTRAEPFEKFLSNYCEAADRLSPILREFGPEQVNAWATDLGQETFAGSTGRVFPVAMKASPLLRAWLGRLGTLGVETRTRWRWQGWDDDGWLFHTPDGPKVLLPKVTVLALGGASWSRLGSDGEWVNHLRGKVDLAPFQPANAGLSMHWSEHMTRHFGQPLKNVDFTAGKFDTRGEATISKRGLEGGGIYAISRGVREGASLLIDLKPDVAIDILASRLSKHRGKYSWTNHIRKTAGLDPAKLALLQECARPLPQDPTLLAELIKALPVPHGGLRPMDEAISTAGGIAFAALGDDLMVRGMPGVFACGEMLDWEAPTGGYLLTACFATGRWAGRHAAVFAQ